ncbi:hypothetical protein EON64_16440 [archaeon]|nr:MAG: hypothetical protein EON64_16440 [archaeon]
MDLSSPEEIQKFLSERLEAVRGERTAIREAFNALDLRIKNSRSKLGPYTKDSVESITQDIERLEREYGRVSRTKAEDRTFMYNLDKLKGKKKVLQANAKLSAEIDDMRSQLGNLRTQLLEKETAIEELTAGLRRVELANRLRVSHRAIEERVVPLSEVYQQLLLKNPFLASTHTPEQGVEFCAARMIGRSGLSLRGVEDSCNVHASIQNNSALHLIGTSKGIAQAYEQLFALCDSQAMELELGEDCLALLLHNQAAILKQIAER